MTAGTVLTQINIKGHPEPPWSLNLPLVDGWQNTQAGGDSAEKNANMCTFPAITVEYCRWH